MVLEFIKKKTKTELKLYKTKKEPDYLIDKIFRLLKKKSIKESNKLRLL